MGIDFQRMFAGAEYTRQGTRTRDPGFAVWRKLSTLDGEQERSISVFGNARKSSTLNGERKRSIAVGFR